MIRSVARRLLIAALMFGSAQLAAREEYEPWQEAEAALPAAPKTADLIEFQLPTSTTNRFFVDGASLSVGADEVVRYTLVVVSATGVRNVSFEGIRCETYERKIYAVGRADGSWAQSTTDRWLPIASNQLNRHPYTLAREFFCDNRVPIRDPREGLAALRSGSRSH